MDNLNRLSAVFFDLDGTLLDTAPDLAQALNYILQNHQRPTLSLESIRPTVALGARGIVCHGFQIDPDDPWFVTLRQEFLSAYEKFLTDKTYFFDGVEEVLNYLDDQRIPWGIVTNKPGWLATPLLAHFNLTQRYRCLVAGDHLPKRKPNPDPLWHACHLVQVDPKSSLYIGDTEQDIDAAKRAGLMSMLALYGYSSSEHHPEKWPYDYVIQSANEIIPWLKTKGLNRIS